MIFQLDPKFIELSTHIFDLGSSEYGADYVGAMSNEYGYCIASSEMTLIVGKPIAPFDELPPAQKAGDEVLVPIHVNGPDTYLDKSSGIELPSVLVFSATGLLTDYDETYITRFVRTSRNMRYSENPETVEAAERWNRSLRNSVVLDKKTVRGLMELLFCKEEHLHDHRSDETCIVFKNFKQNKMLIHHNSEFTIYIRHNLALTRAIKESTW